MTRAIMIIGAAALLAACGGPAPESADAAAARLDAQQIAELERLYPRLGTEPLPPPQPASDTPSELPDDVLASVVGEATYYANSFEGKRTASGIPFRQNQLVAAHRSYPFGTVLRVTNTRNDRSVNVRVVDRGPHGNSAAARRTVIDLSRRAAEALGYAGAGRTAVRVEVLEWGEGLPG